MTTRLYYTDADAHSFDARVVSSTPVGERWHVVLDRTAFYPTSGGQPFDTGKLGATQVLDVVEDDNGDVIHVVSGPLAAEHAVRGEIDVIRRRDHMQQHSGQHILSAAMERVCGVRTVSFHMGAEGSTIDLSREVSAAEVDHAEAEANRILWEDLPVTIRFASEADARGLPLRKDPTRTGELRLVAIGDVDLSACGGTHVSRTGMVGVIAVTGWERFKGATRLAFVCGERARRSHAVLRDTMARCTQALSVGAAELPVAIAKLQQDRKLADHAVTELREALARFRGRELLDAAEAIGHHKVVLAVEPTGDVAELRTLVQSVVSGSGTVAVLMGSGRPAPVVIARSLDVQVNVAEMLKALVAALGGRGGGRPELAQGGVAAPPDDVLAFIRQRLVDM